MLREFREFIARGSVLDMAVGIVIGLAFGGVVASFVADIVMPPIGLLLGGIDLTNRFIRLAGPEAVTLAGAKEAGAVTVNYGVFLNTLVNFLIVGFVIFLLIRQVNRQRRREAPPVTTKECPYCVSRIPVQASRCPQCTSPLPAAEGAS